MSTKFVDIKGLEYFAKKIKEYVDIKVGLEQNKKTNCPNCGAPITSTKCEYCGTDFSVFIKSI